MVPGMTERERLAADARRLEWLAEARFGSATPVVRVSQSAPAVSPQGLWRRVLTAALLLGQRLRALSSRGEPELAEPASVPSR